MGRISSRNSALEAKIAQLRLTLAPIYPLPGGPPHPAFPKTLIGFHLLTENELDSLAHYYHQSSPGPLTTLYPGNMNWDKEFLAKPADNENAYSADAVHLEADSWTSQLLKNAEQLTYSNTPLPEVPGSRTRRNPYSHLTTQQRVGIKRRKFGKFIGFQGMETPTEEIVGRIQASVERAQKRRRETSRKEEEAYLGRRKLA